jgi:hypothetical protein
MAYIFLCFLHIPLHWRSSIRFEDKKISLHLKNVEKERHLYFILSPGKSNSFVLFLATNTPKKFRCSDKKGVYLPL